MKTLKALLVAFWGGGIGMIRGAARGAFLSNAP